MQEMTVEKPKALLKLMGNSLLEWQTYVAREAPISSHLKKFSQAREILSIGIFLGEQCPLDELFFCDPFELVCDFIW